MEERRLAREAEEARRLELEHMEKVYGYTLSQISVSRSALLNDSKLIVRIQYRSFESQVMLIIVIKILWTIVKRTFGLWSHKICGQFVGDILFVEVWTKKCLRCQMYESEWSPGHQRHSCSWISHKVHILKKVNYVIHPVTLISFTRQNI